MINYKEIWDSINLESRNSSEKTQIARLVSTKSVFPVFLSTDFGKNIRLLYVKIDNEDKIKTENLPKFRGLDITLCTSTLGGYINNRFIKFTQTLPNTENIFESVISDLCEIIINVKTLNEMIHAVSKVLNEWKLFFEKQQFELLSTSSQKGLIGELYFLKDYLFQKYSFSESIKYWTGSDRTTHDFQINKIAIEVKATASKQHKKFFISSEKQLDSTGLEHLYLSLFCLNLHNNMSDKTLPSIINEIYKIIHDDSVATFLFQIKLAKYGYNEALADKYNIGFTVFDMKYYEIINGFPRLLQNNIPNGIGDLKYSVMVSACTPFEVTFNKLINI